MLSANLGALLEDSRDRESKAFALEPDDELIKSCLLTHAGQIVHRQFASPPQQVSPHCSRPSLEKAFISRGLGLRAAGAA